MAKASNDDIEFGSDSFLDVVANIVGILIILIVVAGIKANGTPVSATKLAEYVSKHREAAPAVPAPAPQPAIPAGPIVIPISPELAHKAEALKAELAALEVDSRTAAADIDRTTLRQQEVVGESARLARSLASESAELKNWKQQLADSKSRLEQRKVGLQQLEVDIKQAQKDVPPVKTLRHQLTPLSLDVRGKEVHFRLAKNKVAYLPIEELMERLQPQIRRQKDRLLRDGSHHGKVGPVSGFSMDYLVEVQQVSLADELRRGGTMTIGVSGWQLVEEPDLEEETAEEALGNQSLFMRMMRATDPDATITFWVYPDSFEIYRKLQEFAHKENFTVAARPMPFGVSIAGSPHGSRSSGQ